MGKYLLQNNSSKRPLGPEDELFVINTDPEVCLSILKTFPKRHRNYKIKFISPNYCGASSHNIIGIVMKLCDHISRVFRNIMEARKMQIINYYVSTNGVC